MLVYRAVLSVQHLIKVRHIDTTTHQHKRTLCACHTYIDICIACCSSKQTSNKLVIDKMNNTKFLFICHFVMFEGSLICSLQREPSATQIACKSSPTIFVPCAFVCLACAFLCRCVIVGCSLPTAMCHCDFFFRDMFSLVIIIVVCVVGDEALSSFVFCWLKLHEIEQKRRAE